MGMVKQSMMTVQDIMCSELAGAVLGFEVGRLSRMRMRMLFTTEQLQMLAFVRREQAPELWDTVLEPQKPRWEWDKVPDSAALALIRMADHTGTVRVTCLHLGQHCLQMIEPLEHERVVLGSKGLGPMHRWVIAGCGGRIGSTIHFEAPTPEICRAIQQEQGRAVKPVAACIPLLFPSEAAANHACWLLAHLGLTVGQVNSIQPMWG